MKDLIFKYLLDNYEINLTTYTKLKILDKYDQREVTKDWLRREIVVLYGLEDEDGCLLKSDIEIFEVWLDAEIIKIENKVADIQYEIYNKTGVELDLHSSAWIGQLHSDALSSVADLNDDNRELIEGGLLEYVQRNNKMTLD